MHEFKLLYFSKRDTSTFEVSTNLAARSKVTFNVTYQEVLRRVHGVYKHIINVRPEYVRLWHLEYCGNDDTFCRTSNHLPSMYSSLSASVSAKYTRRSLRKTQAK